MLCQDGPIQGEIYYWITDALPLPDLTAIRPPQNRYLLVEFIFPEDAAKPNMTEGLLHTIIRDSLAANFGEVGWGQVGSSLNSMRIILVKLA